MPPLGPARDGLKRCGSGDAAAPGASPFLALAAAPTFALMSVWAAVSGGGPEGLCTSATSGLALHGMPAMYALMSLFHLTPWLALARVRLPGIRLLQAPPGS